MAIRERELRDFLVDAIGTLPIPTYDFSYVKSAQRRSRSSSPSKTWRAASATDHLLLVRSGSVNVFAMEMTHYLTVHGDVIIYVGKADSSGYVPTGASSGFRQIAAAMLAYLVYVTARPQHTTMLSLCAKSQGQYLFPESVDNGRKHVLSDGQLIKWWIRVIDLAVALGKIADGKAGIKRALESKTVDVETEQAGVEETKDVAVRGFLLIPGLDAMSHARYLAASEQQSARWRVGVPYDTGVPVVLSIPRFPDDPKHRFLVDLDKAAERVTHDEFWQRMAHRQECSLGRMVGFLSLELPPLAKAQRSRARISREGLDEKVYKRLIDAMYKGSFADITKAVEATSKLEQTLLVCGKNNQHVRQFMISGPAQHAAREAGTDTGAAPATTSATATAPKVNDLAGLVRKKPRLDNGDRKA